MADAMKVNGRMEGNMEEDMKYLFLKLFTKDNLSMENLKVNFV